MRQCTQCFGDLHELAIFCPRCGQPHEPEFDRLLNQTVGGRYFIYRRLGEGGMSTVFAAIDQADDSVVAVKVTDPRNMVDRQLTYAFDAEAARHYWGEMTERMRREAEALAAVEHPNIVRLHGTGTVNDDLRYVVMEFLRGGTLRDEIAVRGRLALGEALEVALEVTAGLGEIHAREIVHRDLNPRNIFLCAGGEVKVIDFGIAKLPQPPGAPPFTQFSVMRGTVAYSSPEQCQGRPLDHRSDIYSLGVVLYEMVTGTRPFTGRTPTEIALKQIQDAPVSPRALVPGLPVSLETTLLRALAKDPQGRQQSIGELTAELRAVAGRMIIPVAAAPHDVEIIPPLRDFGEDRPATQAETCAEVGAADEPARLPRRATLAATALALAFIAGALLLGKSLLSPTREAATAREAAATAPSPPPASPAPSPDPTAEADALEVAARLSVPATPEAVGPLIYSVPTSSRSAASPASRRIPIVRERKTRPAGQPSVLARAPALPLPKGPASRGDSTPAGRPEAAPPRPEVEPAPVPHDSHPARGDTEQTVAREPEPQHDPAPAQRPEIWRPAPRDAPAGDQPGAQEESQSAREVYAPKLIMWSGYVDRERTVTLELPGVPGTVEVPRGYTKRVGMVEPPNFDNGWRRVVLRVYGRGEVSVVIRWWPRASQVARVNRR